MQQLQKRKLLRLIELNAILIPQEGQEMTFPHPFFLSLTNTIPLNQNSAAK